MTQEEREFIDEKVAANTVKLKGIVSASAIEQKCIDLDFDNKDFEDWVRSLIVTDD